MKSYIIGYPLKNPRSVILWKKFFKKKKLNNFSMESKEVKIQDLKKTLFKFTLDEDFFATAITMPLKNLSAKYVIYGNELSKIASSINLIVKDKKKLIGYNTDIIAALKCIKKFNKRNIMIFGLGGTGKPLTKVIGKKFKKSKIICISSKKHKDLSKFRNIEIKKNILNKDLKKISLFINCSPLGSKLKKNFLKKSPLNKDQMIQLNKKTKVFDIVYQPNATLLNKLCKKSSIKYYGGLNMNTLQANEALKILSKNLSKLKL